MVELVLEKFQSNTKFKRGKDGIEKITVEMTLQEWDVIQAALIKQKPLNVDIARKTDYAEYMSAPCRSCGHKVLKGIYTYCPKCGQKARWNDA